MLPIILAVIAAVSAAGGTAAGIDGGIKMSKAKKKLQNAKERDEANIRRQKEMDELAIKAMDGLGTYELKVLRSFSRFSDCIERIQNRPSFADIKAGDIILPHLELEEVRKASVGAGVLIGGLGGGILGTAGGFAAAGATTAAVMALGTASTGVAIANLSGVAATNATLAAIGGGAVATGGGGMALGTTILGATAAGVGILIGGVIFNMVGSSISEKANDAWMRMEDNEKKLNEICDFLRELRLTAEEYDRLINKVYRRYTRYMKEMESVISGYADKDGKVDWNIFSDNEKLTVKNTVLLVGLLYNMCKVNIVSQSEHDGIVNTVNYEDIEEWSEKAKDVIASMKSE